jgi:predicted Zn-dependent protease
VAEMGLYEDKTLQSFINEKGQQMAKVSHRPELKYEFKIVDSPIVNAFAVPGGYVYFTRGIMAHFNNEAEFAGVLGHEIGHITARHSAKQYSKAMLGPGGPDRRDGGVAAVRQFAEQAQQGLALLFLKFGRDDESQSDRLGVEYSTKIGYDAQEMAGFFNTLDRMSKKGDGESVPTFLSTHPDPADRNKNVQQLAAEWKAKVGDQKLESTATAT